jgi:preprotein translocase subunit YajC
MFTTPAYAQGLFGGESSQAMVQFLPIVLIFVVFYFLLIRPQQKKAKEHKTMLTALRRGDRVVTGGGIVGTVARVNPNDEEIAVDIADNVRVKVLRSTITAVLARTEPVKDAADSDEADAKSKKRVAGGK